MPSNMNNSRTNWLLAFAGLVVGYVRMHIQYHRYSFGSFREFAGHWFAGYVAVGIGGGIFYASIGPLMRRFHGTPIKGNATPIDDALIAWCLAVILCALAVLLLADMGAGHAESLGD